MIKVSFLSGQMQESEYQIFCKVQNAMQCFNLKEQSELYAALYGEKFQKRQFMQAEIKIAIDRYNRIKGYRGMDSFGSPVLKSPRNHDIPDWLL